VEILKSIIVWEKRIGASDLTSSGGIGCIFLCGVPNRVICRSVCLINKVLWVCAHTLISEDIISSQTFLSPNRKEVTTSALVSCRILTFLQRCGSNYSFLLPD
jgi:hypothetical protein